jgi:hypothetical protein
MSETASQGQARERPSARQSPPPGDARAAKEVPVPSLAGRAEQVGAIIVKTLDLAEAGLSLGLTVLTRAGAAAQEALTDRLPANGPQAPAPPMAEHPGPPSAPDPAVEEETFFLTSRVPVAPGGNVQVSFSITNDSLVEPKRVALRVGPLVGDHHGVQIDGTELAVRPARKTISPMDFEKFVLSGTVPSAAPPDVYRGAVIVHSADEMSIPVLLEVAVP